MPAIPILLENGIRFSSKKECYTYFKTKIDGQGCCNSVKKNNIDLYNELCCLFKLHRNSEDKMKDMIDIRIQKNDLNKNAYATYIIKPDSEIDISWCQCCKQNFKKTSDMLTESLRTSVVSQILDFKGICNNICNKCGEKNNPEVDHVIHFDELKYNFLNYCKKNNINIPESFDELPDNRCCFNEEDKEFNDLWFNYHKKHAKLRILCKRCNQKRPKWKKNILDVDYCLI